MKLKELFSEITKVSESIKDCEISRIISNSKADIDNSTLFVCIKGNSFDGHSAAAQMLEKGAAAIVVECDLGLDRQIIVPDTRLALSCLFAQWYDHPERKMRLVGVTGTNGKTTITTVVKQMLQKLGHKTALIGTCQNEIGERVIHTERTTPEPDEFYALLDQMAQEQCEYLVMEVSSQGLAQKRIGKPLFEVAAFTNLTQDHLDVHGDFESYYEAKKLLFGMCRTAVVNVDDEYGRRIIRETDCDKTTFSIKGENADIKAYDISLSAAGSEFTLSKNGCEYKMGFSIAGEYNVSNCCAVIGIMSALGFDVKTVCELAEKCSGVRGRCESIPTNRDFTVICDYAHTPDAIENILSSVKQYAKGRVVCLFGCGGNRDSKKRPLMAKAAAEHSDFVIVTSDNPRNEEPEDIIKDILSGLPKGCDYITIPDRKEAIFWAVKNARRDDVIVMVGKGHEDYQILKNNVKIHFDEREVVAQALELID